MTTYSVFPARMYPNCCKSMFLDFVVHQILPYQSVSVDTFNSKNDVFVAIAQPSMENCMVLEWDHIEMNFRSYDNITGIWTPRFQLRNCWHFTRKTFVDGASWWFLSQLSVEFGRPKCVMFGHEWLHGLVHLVNTCTFNLAVAHKLGSLCMMM